MDIGRHVERIESEGLVFLKKTPIMNGHGIPAAAALHAEADLIARRMEGMVPYALQFKYSGDLPDAEAFRTESRRSAAYFRVEEGFTHFSIPFGYDSAKGTGANYGDIAFFDREMHTTD